MLKRCFEVSRSEHEARATVTALEAALEPNAHDLNILGNFCQSGSLEGVGYQCGLAVRRSSEAWLQRLKRDRGHG